MGCVVGLLRYPSKRFAAVAFLSAVLPLLETDDDGVDDYGVPLDAAAILAGGGACTCCGTAMQRSCISMLIHVCWCVCLLREALADCEPWSLTHVNNAEHSDLTLVVSPKKTEFRAHKAVLKNHSSVVAELAPECR